ncbi:NAD(P)/FAD-dependent oxidoreductase [Streptomyces sp. NBC_01615]|uniref:NAD(P)/FAD-dependent oxidoreductase n=1 Tax=Streptomyces sp. NBC_01615 TaxID=2975898 RepID=UPI0038637FCF
MAGSAAAFHLAKAGIDVLLLEKAHFPQENVSADGLTPRAVHRLIRMGIDIKAPGWTRSRGMRWVAGEHQNTVAEWTVPVRAAGSRLDDLGGLGEASPGDLRTGR